MDDSSCVYRLEHGAAGAGGRRGSCVSGTRGTAKCQEPLTGKDQFSPAREKALGNAAATFHTRPSTGPMHHQSDMAGKRMDHNVFGGFTPAAVRFLGELRMNNSRDWFQERRDLCRSLLEEPAALAVDEWTAGLSRLTGAPLQGKAFRMHRDVRFSRDKTPYNTHLRMSFGECHSTDMHTDRPYWFISLEPERFLIGVGIHAFGSAGLKAWREAVHDETRGKGLVRILKPLLEAGAQHSPPELKKVPAGFPSDHSRAELMRCKGMAVWFDMPHPAELFDAGATRFCLAVWKKQLPVYKWLGSLMPATGGRDGL